MTILLKNRSESPVQKKVCEVFCFVVIESVITIPQLLEPGRSFLHPRSLATVTGFHSLVLTHLSNPDGTNLL